MSNCDTKPQKCCRCYHGTVLHYVLLRARVAQYYHGVAREIEAVRLAFIHVVSVLNKMINDHIVVRCYSHSADKRYFVLAK